MPRIPEPYMRSEYRGLDVNEGRILRAFLRREDPDIETLETRVRLGPGEELPSYVRPEFQQAWKAASQFKLDVAVETPTEWLLVELKDHVRTSALGQAISYQFWFERERDIRKPTVPIVTSEVINPSAVGPHHGSGVRLVPLSTRAAELLEKGRQALR